MALFASSAVAICELLLAQLFYAPNKVTGSLTDFIIQRLKVSYCSLLLLLKCSCPAVRVGVLEAVRVGVLEAFGMPHD